MYFYYKGICYTIFDPSKYWVENTSKSVLYNNSKNHTFNHYMYIFYEFLRLLHITLKLLYKPNMEFLICGDINDDYLSDSDSKQQLSLSLSTCNMLHTANLP